MTTDTPNEPITLDSLMESVLSSMHDIHDPADKQFEQATDQYVKLHKLKMEEIKTTTDSSVSLQEVELKSRPDRVKADTWVLAGANVLGILMIVGHERAHIITTKAIQFAGKLR